MDCSTPGFSVHHQLPELAPTHVHLVGGATQISSSVVPFSSCFKSFPASGSFPMSQLCIYAQEWDCRVIVSVQLLSRVQLFATPWTAACQAFLSFTRECQRSAAAAAQDSASPEADGNFLHQSLSKTEKEGSLPNSF